MKKSRKFYVGILILCIVGIVIFGVAYIPEKTVDLLTDVEEIGEYVIDYRCNYVPSYNVILNEMVESIVMVAAHPLSNDVEVAMVDCTFWKKQLFRREIINSKYIKFSDWESGGIND